MVMLILLELYYEAPFFGIFLKYFDYVSIFSIFFLLYKVTLIKLSGSGQKGSF
jgi:hypothetical protein